MEKIYDIIIIGSGPAAFAAGIYGGRSEADILILEQSAPGGRLLNTHLVENYPGFESISGGELALSFLNHTQKFGVKTAYETVEKLSDVHEPIKLIQTNANTYKARSIIIASGTKSRLLDLPKVDKFFGKGISVCVICDGAFHRKKPIALVGGGNSAAEESLFASNLASKVYIINIMDKIMAEKITTEKIKTKDNIEVRNNSEVIEILGEDKLEGIKVKNNETNQEEIIDLSGLFFYIGNIPNTHFAHELNIVNEQGYIDVNMRTMETAIPGIFAAGDVIEKQFRQITTSVADGTIAVLSAINYLETH